MYDAILLPTDGSPGSDAAVDHAMHVAAQNDAVVHAVHSIDVMERGDNTENVADSENELHERARDILEPIHAAADEAGVEVEEEVIEGIAHETLIDYTKAKGIDLIVMGTHGKTGLSRVLLGSTAEKVVRNSPVPVLTVRDGNDD